MNQIQNIKYLNRCHDTVQFGLKKTDRQRVYCLLSFNGECGEYSANVRDEWVTTQRKSWRLCQRREWKGEVSKQDKVIITGCKGQIQSCTCREIKWGTGVEPAGEFQNSGRWRVLSEVKQVEALAAMEALAGCWLPKVDYQEKVSVLSNSQDFTSVFRWQTQRWWSSSWGTVTPTDRRRGESTRKVHLLAETTNWGCSPTPLE